MDRPLLIIVFALFGATASAQVYRWVDDLGRTHYSDRPQLGVNASKSGLPSASSKSASADPIPSGGLLIGPYTSFDIVSPEPNETLRQDTGNVPFSLILDPPLLEGHRIELLLDAASIPVETPVGSQFSLSGVAYGSHVAVVQIRDADGQIVARTAPVNFHLRKPLPPGVIQ